VDRPPGVGVEHVDGQHALGRVGRAGPVEGVREQAAAPALLPKAAPTAHIDIGYVGTRQDDRQGGRIAERIRVPGRMYLDAEGEREPILAELKILRLNTGSHEARIRLRNPGPREAELAVADKRSEIRLLLRMRLPEVLGEEHLLDRVAEARVLLGDLDC